MKGINNKYARRYYKNLARRNLMAHSSQTMSFFKREANRRVRHADIVGNGGHYKTLKDILWVKMYLYD